MARPEKEYIKLPGKGRPPFPASMAGGAFRLYLGRDHLLKVEASYWAERYRRYYFKDIRLLQITQTRTDLVVTIIILALTLFFGVLGYVFAETARIVLWSIAGSFVMALVIHLLLGPRCKVRITTPLGTDDLHSLSRLRVARKVFDRIGPLIRDVQETLNPEDLVERLSVEVAGPVSQFVIPKVQAPSAFIEPPKGKKWVAFIFAFFLLVHAGLSLFQQMQPSPWVLPAALSVLATAFAWSIFLLIRPAPGCPRKLTTSFIVYLGIYGVLLYVVMIQVAISNPEKMTHQNAIYPAMLHQAMLTNGFNTFLNLFTAVGSGVLGLLTAGLVATNRLDMEEVETSQPPDVSG